MFLSPVTWVRRGAVGAALVALVAPLALAAPSSVGGSAVAQPPPNSGGVRAWNLHAVNALVNAPTAPVPGAGQTPPVSEMHLAMVHGAIFDAVNSIAGGYEPYLTGLPPASPSASQDAAIAAAARGVLVGLGRGLVPPLPPVVQDRINALYADAIAGIPEPAKSAGIAAGAAAAARMLDVRATDRRYVPFSFLVGDDAGEWRPTLPAFVNDPFAWVARVEPFLLDNPTQLRTKGPPALTSRAYAKEYDEVKRLGELGTGRSNEQEAIASFFTANPVPMFNSAFRVIAEGERLTLVEEARLFAMLNTAGADTLITCFSNKAWWSNWRPITAIQLGDEDGNSRTEGDAGWLPRNAAPPYPDNPSGYNCITSAWMYTARDFFGTDRLTFSLVSIVPNQPDATRVYRRFTDVIDDTIDARVYEGLHFRSADTQAAGLGKAVARWLDDRYFQPVR